MPNLAQEEQQKSAPEEIEVSTEAEMEVTPPTPEVAVNSHFDFKLEGWPASAFLITLTLCLSGVTIYGINMWGKVRLSQVPSAAN